MASSAVVCVARCLASTHFVRSEHKTEIIGDLRLHNEELHSLNRSPNTSIVRVIKSRRLRWAGQVARMEESRSAFKILTGKPTGKRPLGGSMPHSQGLSNNLYPEPNQPNSSY